MKVGSKVRFVESELTLLIRDVCNLDLIGETGTVVVMGHDCDDHDTEETDVLVMMDNTKKAPRPSGRIYCTEDELEVIYE